MLTQIDGRFRRGRRRTLAGLCFLYVWLSAASPALAELPSGKSRHDVDVGGTRIAVFAYKPDGYEDGPLIVTFHGSVPDGAFSRNAMTRLAETEKSLVIAPEFDRKRFPRWAYELAGIAERVERSGAVEFLARPPERWTGAVVLELIEWARREEGRKDLPYYLVGHSGGAQFLSRFAAFVPNEARRIVLANAGSYLLADESQAFPYGFARVSDGLSIEQAMRRYVGSPITIFLGTEDLQRRGLSRRPGAERQGLTRYERGVHAFSTAGAFAAKRGWPCNWRLVDVPEAGHSSKAMFGGPEARAAIFGAGSSALERPCG